MCASLNSINRRRNRLPLAAPRSQRGTVLVMALLIVAVVAGLSISFANEYQLGLTRAETRWHGQQARAYLRGVESLAMTWLKEDDPAADYFGEGWDTEIPYEVEGGWLSGSLSDASGRLNLNGLNTPFVENKPANSHERYSEIQRRFIRLVQCFPDEPLDENAAIALLEAVVDWMDVDDEESGFNGAESNYYMSGDLPYLAANGPFMSVDELRLVRYMTPQLMTFLRAYVTVLPAGEGLNVNTMPPLLWRTLNAGDRLEPLSELEAQQLAQALPEEGYYKDLAEVTANGELVGGGDLNTDGLTVKTSYFWLRTQVSLVNQQRITNSLLHRSGTDIRVVRRSDGY